MSDLINNLIDKLHRSKFLGRIFPTLDHCLQGELVDCNSVLDIGCGPSSPLQYCENIEYSVEVEAYKPYLEKSKEKNIHTKYIDSKIEDLNFPNRSFDAVIMIEVIEHLSKQDGLSILRKAEKWARKKVIVTTPNGFLQQKDIDNNPYQRHLSGWSLKEMNKTLGFKIYGLAGLKCLRQPRECDTGEANLLTSIKYWPKLFWFIIAALSQIFTYHFPYLAFELFCVKEL